jgi:phosphoribosylformylglycinamidine (FGAM) synthase PurS component
MHGTYLIEVAHKKGVKDPLAAEVAEDLKQFAGRARCAVATSKLYRLIGNLTAEQRARIGSELLSDPVIEEFHDGSNPSPPPSPLLKGRGSKGEGLKTVTLDVWYKSGVTDAVGESVLKGLRDLNLNEIEDVRTGMRYRFIGLHDAKTADKLALAALINPLIHDHNIHAD